MRYPCNHKYIIFCWRCNQWRIYWDIYIEWSAAQKKLIYVHWPHHTWELREKQYRRPDKSSGAYGIMIYIYFAELRCDIRCWGWSHPLNSMRKVFEYKYYLWHFKMCESVCLAIKNEAEYHHCDNEFYVLGQNIYLQKKSIPFYERHNWS